MCVFLIHSVSVCSYECVCVSDCTAILCAFGGSWSELGRIPESSVAQSLSSEGSYGRSPKTETHNTELVCCDDNMVVSWTLICFIIPLRPKHEKKGTVN